MEITKEIQRLHKCAGYTREEFKLLCAALFVVQSDCSDWDNIRIDLQEGQVIHNITGQVLLSQEH